MPANKTYELSIIHPEKNSLNIELIKEVLIVNEIPIEDIVEISKAGKVYIALFFNQKRNLLRIQKRIQELKLKRVIFKIKDLRKEDWETKWKKDFKAFKLTKKYIIVPAWDRKFKRTRDLKSVYIDTGMAFGTGLHPTTRYMAQFIEEYEGKYDTFLDLGTGTGILSIIAQCSGAQAGDGVDISPDAVKTAIKNFKLNDINVFKLHCCDIASLKLRRKYDFVAANLITDDLIQFKDKILSYIKDGKYLAVSGISLSNFSRFRKVYQKLPLRCVKISKGNAWSAILYRKI